LAVIQRSTGASAPKLRSNAGVTKDLSSNFTSCDNHKSPHAAPERSKAWPNAYEKTVQLFEAALPATDFEGTPAKAS
jgi:hypothetical protein